MAKRARATEAAPDAGGVRRRAGLDAQRALHLADGHRGNLRSGGEARLQRRARAGARARHRTFLRPDAGVDGSSVAAHRHRAGPDHRQHRAPPLPGCRHSRAGLRGGAAGGKLVRSRDLKCPVRRLQGERSAVRRTQFPHPRLLLREGAAAGARGRAARLRHLQGDARQSELRLARLPLGQSGLPRRHAAAEHGFQAECQYGGDHRHHLSAQARHGRAAGQHRLAEAGGARERRGRGFSDQRILRREPAHDARNDGDGGHDVPRQ